MGTTRAEYKGSILTFTDPDTKETSLPAAPVYFVEDFLGETFDTGKWATVETNLNTAIGLMADESNGVLSLIIDADNNAEEATLYWGDQRPLNAGYNLNIEGRLRITTPGTACAMVFGVATDANGTPDSVAAHAWFRLQASLALLAETDDATTDDDDNDCGQTLVSGTWYVFRIDLSSLGDVGFYLDGVLLDPGTLSISAISAGNSAMQPYLSLIKTSGTATARVDVDYIRCWQERA